MNYESFVNELRPLILKHSQLKSLRLTCEDSDFKTWRHNISDLIVRIQDKGYIVNCNIEDRNFTNNGGLYGTPSVEEQITYYDRDLQNTIIELQTIVEQFDKYGDPKSSDTKDVQKQELKMPEKITISWLNKHVSMKQWCFVCAVILATFVFGLKLGHSKIYSDILNHLEPKELKETLNK